jgi:hypothetical protein
MINPYLVRAIDETRIAFLRAHPHCQECAKEGYIVPAVAVDMVGRDGLKSLCLRCFSDLERDRKENQNQED